MRNKYPGTCYRCGGEVKAGDGHFEKMADHHRKRGVSDLGKWRVQHVECAIKYRGTDHHANAGPTS